MTTDQPAKPASTGPLASLWPAARVDTVASPARGGDVYRPLLFLDTVTWFGTETAADGNEVRLLLVHGDGRPPSVLRTFPASPAPSIDATAAAAGELAWVESAVDPAGATHAQLWQADWRAGTPPRLITAAMGSVVTAHSRYDLQIVGTRVVWLARDDAATPVTVLRSVNLDGTSPNAQPLAGEFALTRWPWVIESSGEPGESVRLVDVVAAASTVVAANAEDILSCAPVWCTVLVLGADGAPSKVDVLRVDGSVRRNVAGADVTAVVDGVALLERFAVLSSSAAASPARHELRLYDTQTDRLAVVAADATDIICADQFLSWSTPDAWHTLDLRTLR